MSHAIVAPPGAVGTATSENREAGSGIGRAFRGVYDSMIRAQQARANARVRPYLAAQTDAALERLGFTKAEIAEIRNSATPRALPFV